MISLPSSGAERRKQNRETTFKAGRELLKEKEGLVDGGAGKKDLLSLLGELGF